MKNLTKKAYCGTIYMWTDMPQFEMEGDNYEEKNIK